MSIARHLETLTTQVTYADFPPQALEHAVMLISSMVASAALIRDCLLLDPEEFRRRPTENLDPVLVA